MVYTRSNREIDLISKSCQIVADTLEMISGYIAPVISVLDLDKKAENYIISCGARPAFKGYMGFPSTLCISIDVLELGKKARFNIPGTTKNNWK